MRPSPEAAVPRSAPSRLCIGLVVDSWDWHARELAEALDPFADTVAIKLEACGFEFLEALAEDGHTLRPGEATEHNGSIHYVCCKR